MIILSIIVSSISDSYRTLSAQALEALQDFYKDRDRHEKEFEDIKVKAGEGAEDVSISMETFAEDWQISQFWVRIFEIQ